ncbi:hypothetical protein EWM64_g7704 [Hericium alpestre]|uniref:Uncharacterized protein n=1 Tax=Hericium alpestre TaxID=135208 RepID=A0A4Y9ZN65_9AGAM|nr:hypothetical protein EWM64_g7704 [Hericium alpestre]
MRLADAISVFVPRKHECAWEVVDSKNVDPVAVCDQDDDLDVIYVHETDVVRTYMFDVRDEKDFHNALLFAQRQFVEEVRSKGYNTLWTEGWQATLLRKGKKHRIEVRYTARPACLSGKPLQDHEPPFMAVLDDMRKTTSQSL